MGEADHGLRGLTGVIQASAEYELHGTRVVRLRRQPMTRGLNRNRVLKNVFKGAVTAASTHPGALQDSCHAMRHVLLARINEVAGTVTRG